MAYRTDGTANFNFFITSNLREHKEDRGGDYIRYDRAGQLMYIGDPDFATTVKAGEVRLSTVDDLTAGSDTVALTPKVYKDDVTNVKSEIQGDIAAVNSKIDVTNENVSDISNKVTRLDNNTVKVTGYQDISGSKTFTDKPTFTKGINTAYIDTRDGEEAIRVTSQDIAFQFPLKVKSIKDYDSNAYYLRQGKVIAGDNVQIVNTADGIKISSTAQGDVTLAGDNSFTGNNTFDGVSTFNGDTWVNSLKVGTSLKNQQDKLFLSQSSITAGDNITVEETTDGVKISSTGGGSSEPPANMVTTDTEQTITGAKTLDNSLYVNNPDMMSGVKSISTEDLYCSSIELGRVWTSKNSDYIYANNYRRISAIAKNGVSIPMITCNTAGADPNVISFGVSDAYDVIIPARAKTYGGKKFLVQGSVTAGSDNLLITETTDGVQIICNAPTNAQIEALQRLINDLSTKIDNLTTRLNNLEEVIDGGVAGSIYAPEPQKLQEQVVEGLSINERINSVTEDVQVNDNGGT